MNRLMVVCVVIVSLGIGVQGAGDPPSPTHEIALSGHRFTLPVGFTIERVAGPPLVNRPIVADFDEQGRLYVADSSGSNDKVDEQLKQKPHRIVRLDDRDGDGEFDESTVFADRMMFPEGAMWHKGSLYVSAPPSIWKLTDTDGDGIADERVEWFKGKTLTGCANDLHGPYLGPDGLIYWCKGAFAKQTYERPGRPPFVTRAAHIFRCRPDGSGIEAVMTGGMDNPVDVVFTRTGERIFTTTFLQTPGGGLRDGLIHAVYGGIYGKDHDPIYEHPWTSPALMPVLSHMGAAAPCGLIRYESPQFGPEYQDNLFACQFNMHKISRHVLTPKGATFESRDVDFLVSGNLDFHPTDIVEDADGSVLVVDTGGWYKLCCPSSQLHKPDLLGAIYRIRRTDGGRFADPSGRKIAWGKLKPDEITRLLSDVRFAIRRRAMQTLADQGEAAVPALIQVLQSAPAIEERRNAVWTLTRIDHADARAAVRTALSDRDETVRQAALNSISVWRDAGALSHVLPALEAPAPALRRGAAEALGRIGNRDAVPALLKALGATTDHVLEHSLTYALIEIAHRPATEAGLTSANPRIRRAALTAIDQMGGPLDAQVVAKDLNAKEPALKETAWWIASRHPEWGAALAGNLREQLDAKQQTSDERAELVRRLSRFAKAGPVQEFLAERLRDSAASPEARRTVLRAMAQASLRDTPPTWITALTQLFSGGDRELIPEALAATRAMRWPRQRPENLVKALMTIARQDETPVAMRLGALAAIPGALPALDAPLFALLRGQLDSEKPVAQRLLAADVLSRAKLNSEQLLALAAALSAVGMMEADRLLDAFAQTSEEKIGRSVVAALKASPARSSLRPETVRPRLAKYSATVLKEADELYASLDADGLRQKARLEGLLTTMHTGDVRRGQVIFHGTKAACVSCHAIGYLGGKIGPDMTHIGRIRTERDLLESIVFPNASLVRSYEPVQVTTKAGKMYNGLIRKDAPDELVLALNATEEIRLARDEIDEVQPSRVSIMPSGFDQQLSPQELADLVAFLKACQ